MPKRPPSGPRETLPETETPAPVPASERLPGDEPPEQPKTFVLPSELVLRGSDKGWK
jgi:hypothetical protein